MHIGLGLSLKAQLRSSGISSPELLTNSTFDTDTTGWTFEGTATNTSTAGFLAGTTGGATNILAHQSFTSEIGEKYKLTLVRGPQNTGIYVGTGIGSTTNLNTGFATGTSQTRFFDASATETFVTVMSFGATSPASVSTVSVLLGDELTPNSNFDVDTTGWTFEATATDTSVAGVISGTSGGASNLVAHTSFESEIGRRYAVRFVRANDVNSALYIGNSAGNSGIVSSGFGTSGIVNLELTATATETFLSLMSIGANSNAAATQVSAYG